MWKLVDFFGPILAWEATTIVRRRRYFVLRVVYGFALLFWCYTTYTSSYFLYFSADGGRSNIKAMADFGKNFFSAFSTLSMSAILFLTPAYVASAIALERQRRTIEYLFASDLSNREIVLGKWAARSLNVAALILAGIPVLYLAGLAGGIDFRQLLMVAFVGIVALASAASLAILVSAHVDTYQKANSLTYSLLVALLILQVAFTWLAASFVELVEYIAAFPELRLLRGWIESIGGILYDSSPYVMIDLLVSSTARTSEERIRSSLAWYTGLHFIFSVLCLGWSVWNVRAAYLRSVSGKSGGRWFRRQPVATGESRAIGNFPMIWKEWRCGPGRMGRPAKILLTLIALALQIPLLEYLLGTAIVSPNNMSASDLNVYIRIVATIAIGLGFLSTAMRGASSIGIERDRDTWTTLVSSPIEGKEIIDAKLAGALKPLATVFVIVGPMWLLGAVAGAISPLAMPASLVVVAAYGWFLANLGVFQSLRRRSTGRATTVTILICLALGGVGHMFGGALLLVPAMFIRGGGAFFAALYSTSLPWVVVAGSMFRFSDFESSSSQATLFIGMAFFFVAAYAAAGFALYYRSVNEFERWRRLEQGGG